MYLEKVRNFLPVQPLASKLFVSVKLAFQTQVLIAQQETITNIFSTFVACSMSVLFFLCQVSRPAQPNENKLLNQAGIEREPHYH